MNVKTMSFRVENPADGSELAVLEESSPAAVAAAVQAARHAFPSWAGTPAHKRGDVLIRAAELLDGTADELSRLLTFENGKPLAQAREEMATSSRLLRKYAYEGIRLHGETFPGDAQAGTERDLILSKREPRGVLAAIIPFNAPVEILVHKIAPALASGNVVVVKPSEDAPLAVSRLVELLHEAGLPEDCLQIVNGGTATGQALVADPGVDIAALTGSTAAGISVATTVAARLAPVMLELGGNDPLIVLPDADLPHVIDQVIWGRTLANGQICCANKRLLVHRDVTTEFTDRLEARVKELRMGDPFGDDTDIGPLITLEAAERVGQQVSQAVGDGARMICGTGRPDGTWFAPTMLINVDTDNPIAHDIEVFGPVFAVMSFTDDNEAIALANATTYGLAASVFTQDIKQALKFAHHLQAGTVSVNGTGLYRPDAIEWGGYKQSGYGHEGLRAAFDQMTTNKTIALRGVLPTEASGYPA